MTATPLPAPPAPAGGAAALPRRPGKVGSPGPPPDGRPPEAAPPPPRPAGPRRRGGRSPPAHPLPAAHDPGSADARGHGRRPDLPRRRLRDPAHDRVGDPLV